MSNSPVSKIDLYGLQGLDVNSFMGAIMGVGTAIVEDLTGADFPAPQGNDSYSSSFRGAEEMGHAGMAVTGAGLAVLGGEMIVGGGAATLTGVGATVGVPAAGTGAAVAAGGGWIAANATRNMNNSGSAGNEKRIRNPDGAKGKPDHQDKVKELTEKANSELKPGETIKTERKIAGHSGSNRRPDVQILDKNEKTRKIFEAERKPKSARNIKREKEYDNLKIEHETHKVGN